MQLAEPSRPLVDRIKPNGFVKATNFVVVPNRRRRPPVDKGRKSNYNTRKKDYLLGSILRFQFVKDLALFAGIKEEVIRQFLERHPEYAQAIDAMSATPSPTLAPAPAGKERQLGTGHSLPEKAPALWAKDKRPDDTPPVFIQRHYGPWLGKGFSQATLRHLDPQAEKAWRHWKRKNDTPPWFDLPTKSEQLARETSVLAPPGSPEAAALRRLGGRLYKQQRTRHS